MTDNITDDAKVEQEDLEDKVEIIDDDPMIAEMIEAEKEIKALEEESKEESDENENSKTEDSDTDKEDGSTPMIPKARFDQVLAERDQAREEAGYMKGFLAASKNINNVREQEKETNNEQEETSEGDSVNDIDKAIEAAELRKLELAERYDEGEISTKEWKEAELSIDKEIRELSKQQLDMVAEKSKAITNEILTAQQQQDFINSQALSIQQNHPNVEVIDNLPEATSNAVWESINNQAILNLVSRGVNLQDGDIQSQVMLMREKAALTDQLTPENTASLLMGKYQFVDPTQYNKSSDNNSSQSNENGVGKKGLSENAKNLSDKLDLANSQPPSIADMGAGNNTGELTEQALENMSDDQIADLIERQPQTIQRILGTSAN